MPLAPDGATFRATIPIERWGIYRAQATFEGDTDHAPATATSEPRKVRTPPPVRQGSRGEWVLTLERRLIELNYHLKRPNQGFDYRTADAVLAFHKVNGMGRGEAVTKATWKRLADPRTPKPKAKRPKEHIEVDQTKQVLYVVKNNRVTDILHVSTGAGAATRNGTFTFHREVNGYSGGGLYYPTYFDGLRAIHGWPEVPTYNASHGCVRLPMWAAKWAFDLVELGDKIRIYHS